MMEKTKDNSKVVEYYKTNKEEIKKIIAHGEPLARIQAKAVEKLAKKRMEDQV